MSLPSGWPGWTDGTGPLVLVALILAAAIPGARAALDKPFRVRRILGRDLDAFTAYPQAELERMVVASARHALRGWRAWAAIYAPLLIGWAGAIFLSAFLRLSGGVPHRAWLGWVGVAFFVGGGACARTALENRLIRAEWRRSHANPGS